MKSDVKVTAPLQRQAWIDRVTPPVERLRPGLWSIPVPIPNNPVRYVLVYAFESDAGVTIVDAGWDTESAWQALTEGLATAGFAVGDVRGVLVTHLHPDHYGLAGRVREASGAWVALHSADAELIPGRYGAGMDDVIGSMRALMSDHGVPDSMVRELSNASLGIRSYVDAVGPDILLEDGAHADVPGWDIVVVHTPGHSPGHVCFYDRDHRLLLSGDHVLPRITPSITFHTQQVANPLADFLDALARVRDLDVDDVLPAHQWRFAPLRERVDELVAHHHVRLDKTVRIVRGHPGATCWEVTLQMSWSRPWIELSEFMRRTAVGETLAHLVLLESRGGVRRIGAAPVRWEVV